MLRTSLKIFIILFVFSCAPKKENTRVQNKYDFIYGEIKKEQLYEKYPFWGEQEKSYKPDPLVISQINAQHKQVEVIVFLGSWCADSRKNVPIFFKSIMGNSNFEVEMWALNLKKQINNGLHELYKIKRVPTFIFKYNDKEIGRITEFPKKTMEIDILEILNKIQ